MLRNSPDVESRPFGFIHERNNEGDAPTSSPVTVDATDDFKFNFEMTSQPQDFSSSKSLKSSYSSPRMLFSVPEGTQEDESGDRCSPQCVPCNDISEMTPDPIKELEARNDRILKENVQLLCTSLGVTEDGKCLVLIYLFYIYPISTNRCQRCFSLVRLVSYIILYLLLL
jgi:hypothetical protein